MVITEDIYTDQAFSQGYRHQPRILDKAQAEALKPVVKEIKRHGAVAVAQMMHAGARSQENSFVIRTAWTKCRSSEGKQMDFHFGEDAFPQPVAMTEEQVSDAIAGFSASAAEAIQIARFDAIKIHGANGYPLDQFLTEYTNERTDGWGSSTEVPCRLNKLPQLGTLSRR